jgi:NAD-dependent deacetylase
LIIQNVDACTRRPARRPNAWSRSTHDPRGHLPDGGARPRAGAGARAGEEDPACRSCGDPEVGHDLVRPDPGADDLTRAEHAARDCDLLLAVGSTLSVYPIAGVVPVAKRSGARVVILNAEPTEMDELADAVIRGSIGEILPVLVGGA